MSDIDQRTLEWVASAVGLGATFVGARTLTWRRWANEYRAAPEADRPDVLRRFLATFPGWKEDEARDELQTWESTPLLDEADRRVCAVSEPEDPTVFVHGDLWQGNTLWDSDECVGLIDWETAGAGSYGVDLGCLRWDAAILFGAWAADEITAGWEETSGLGAASIPYWDVVAALNTPADLGAFLPSMQHEGRGDLDGQTLTDRRDAFLVDALDRMKA